MYLRQKILDVCLHRDILLALKSIRAVVPEVVAVGVLAAQLALGNLKIPLLQKTELVKQRFFLFKQYLTELGDLCGFGRISSRIHHKSLLLHIYSQKPHLQTLEPIPPGDSSIRLSPSRRSGPHGETPTGAAAPPG